MQLVCNIGAIRVEKRCWSFSLRVQTCLVTNQVLAGWEKLLQKAESSSTFWSKICTCCVFYRPKANLFCRK